MSQPAKDLFQLQVELVDAKVDMAVSKANDRVLERIDRALERIADLKSEVTQRLIAVETKLGIVNETEKEIKARIFASKSHVKTNIIDYTFKASWLLLASITTYFLVHFHIIIK